ncbi:hypothetical protein LTR91_003794 [Friedmanniomyces endolithicus]|uniref:PH domain-containing protein n=1 Tax=Friedmanniomyces endolithicus TaxID=329885 RepID=A0AAN6QZ44_9PEZI|nr:hypothetical protein LTR82_016799 [Friedmanniomyces endolithicus]KAK0315395.1 hypothetical protein LTR01_000693 [Friedmanniomyces endolithicus]KAK0827109.1 hypothetical protein LTR73_005892 [Friedmanniomyces endolithicus]KAK0927397.1 hypothetical protein LTR57_003560 [Friedmanniomyces endolithicus]KAK0986378.1 hypothetical protein LTS01_009903 [Friedmanniomyces endolithicus]
MAFSPFALSILGMDAENRRRLPEDDMAPMQDTSRTAPVRHSRRATSHYNFFQTLCSAAQDSPPAYALAIKHQAPAARQRGEAREKLPGYSCSVSAEARLLLQLESVNPLHGVSESDWREVFVTLRGTLFSIYRVKDGGAGRLLRSYTLQHAEVGLAVDSQHQVLVPQTRLAHFIPVYARRKAWQKDPSLFKPVTQHILRLRIETDQILLADADEDRLHDFIHAISAGIDISCAIDERSIPRQCTVPRRRRRQRPTSDNLNNPILLAEQERILREMYPAFAEHTPTQQQQIQRTLTYMQVNESAPTPSREEDDLDFAIIREDFATPTAIAPTQTTGTAPRPGMSRQTTASSLTSTFSSDMMYATSPANFTPSGKWQPPHPRTATQINRYARRCMPVLLAEAVRASDVLICNGKRVKINWRMEMLEEWALSPPSYKSHAVKVTTKVPTEHVEVALRRTGSQTSQTPSSATNSSPVSLSPGSVVDEGGDRIEAVEGSLGGLELVKVVTGVEKESPRHSAAVQFPHLEETKTVEERVSGTQVHGVVFCF